MRSDRLPWLLVLGLMIALVMMRGLVGVRGAELKVAKERADSLAVVADSLKTVAVKADTLLVRITDTVMVVVERARENAAVSADSVRAHVDSVGALHLDSLLASHAQEVEALETLAEANLTWGNTWKDYALALENQAAQLKIANTLALGMLRSQKRRTTAYQVGLALVGTAIVVNAIR